MPKRQTREKGSEEDHVEDQQCLNTRNKRAKTGKADKASQLARKRELDRIAQRTLREKTKRYIAHLENTVEACKSGNGSEIITGLLNYLSSMYTELEAHRKMVADIGAIIGSESASGTQRETQHPPMPFELSSLLAKPWTVCSNSSANLSQPFSCLVDNSIASPSAIVPGLCADESFGGIHGESNESGIGISHDLSDAPPQNQETSQPEFLDSLMQSSGPTDKELETLNEGPNSGDIAIQDGYVSSALENINHTEHSDDGGSNSQNNQAQQNIPTEFWPIPLFTAPLGNLWAETNLILGKLLWVDSDRAGKARELDNGTIFKAMSSGWNSLSESDQENPVIQILREYDERLWKGLDPVNRLAIAYKNQHLIKYFLNADPVDFSSLPVWQRPRHFSRTKSHQIGIYFFAWPALRDRLLHEHNTFPMDDLASAFREYFRFDWPFSFEDTFYLDPETGKHRASPLFERYHGNLKHWKIDKEFFSIFPELTADINAGDQGGGSIDSGSATSGENEQVHSLPQKDKGRGPRLGMAVPEQWISQLLATGPFGIN